MKVYVLVDESSESDENVGVYRTLLEAEKRCRELVVLSFTGRSERWEKAHAASEPPPSLPEVAKWDRYDMLDFIQYSTEANYGSTANNLNEYYSIQEWEI